MRALDRARRGGHALQRAAERAAPGDVLLPQQPQQQAQVFVQARPQVGGGDAEGDVGLLRHAAGHDELGPPAGQHVEGGELFRDAYGIAVGQQGDAGGQAQGGGSGRDRGEQEFGRGDDVTGEVVLADGHAGESGLLRHDGLVDHGADALGLGGRATGAWIRQVIPEDQQVDLHKA